MIDMNDRKIQVNGIAFKSANESPHRDPDRANVFIYDSTRHSFVHIAIVLFKFHEKKRGHTYAFKIPSSLTSAVLIDFENLKGHNEIQCARIMLLQ